MKSLIVTGDVNLLGVEDADVPFRRIAPELNAADAVFANLECMLSARNGAHVIRGEGFGADPEVGVEVLRKGNIQAVGIANNVNYGYEAIPASVRALESGGILHTGAGSDATAARQPAVVEANGVRYGFLQRTSVYWATNHAAGPAAPGVAVLAGHTAYEAPMYHFDPAKMPPNRPGEHPTVLTWANREHLASFQADIAALKEEADIVVASCHWGLRGDVLEYMREIAHGAIDAGADVVVGHGPHQPLAIGTYRGRTIFYGLGSFSFGRGHSGAHGDWVGLMARVEGEPGRLSTSFEFVRHNDANETLFRSVAEEPDALEQLTAASKPEGAELVVDGNRVTVQPLATT